MSYLRDMPMHVPLYHWIFLAASGLAVESSLRASIATATPSAPTGALRPCRQTGGKEFCSSSYRGVFGREWLRP